MTRTFLSSLFIVCALASSAFSGEPQPAARPAALTVVSAGPNSETATLAEANEIRVVFSEPMVTLGRVPTPVRADFFRVAPAVSGTFRWSGTTILTFTPDPKRPLPYATRYEVTIDTTATAVSGRRLAQPYRFSFTTPTVKLLQTNWYRRGGRAGAQMVVLLRFNQPVRSSDVAAHVSARFEPHQWAPPMLTPAADPQARAQFAAKVAATGAVAAARAAVPLRLTSDWDKKRFLPSRDLVVLETATVVPPESWIALRIDRSVPSPAGDRTPSDEQTFTIQAEPAFFINGFECSTQCDPDRWNPILLRSEVKVADFVAASKAVDITTAAPAPVPKLAKPKPRRPYDGDQGAALTLEDAGFNAQPPARTYAVTVTPDLKSTDGQSLGYTWLGVVENWRQRPFTSFGDGHGVWEKGGGSVLPFYSRNFRDVTHWAAPVALDQLMPTVLGLQPRFNATPVGPGMPRRLAVTPDRIQSHGLDLSGALLPSGSGLVWTAVREGTPIEKARTGASDHRVRASVVQVTNLGITVKDSPRNTLVFVTRLDTGAPVAGAKVSIVKLDNSIAWTGTSGDDGVAIAPETPLREPNGWWRFSYIVTAQKDGDVAYAGSDWNEGVLPWDFDLRFNLREAEPLLRGTVFTDRGVYRLGEEVHFKSILRHNTPNGVQLLPPGTAVWMSVRDSQARLVDERTVKVGAWSSADWTVTLPLDGALGNYSVQAVLESDRPKPGTRPPSQRAEDPDPDADQRAPYHKVVNGSFLVAAYRRPDFRVDVMLTAAQAIAGAPLKGVVTSRYLFGAPMGARPANWVFSKTPLGEAPAAVRERFPDDRWLFVGWSEQATPESGEVRRDASELTSTGELALTLDTKLDAGVPYSYTLEGDVEDVSRQHIANRASVTVHPAAWYVGIRKPSYFVEQKNGLKTEVITVTPDGQVAPGVPVTLKLTQVQWQSVRRAEGNGFYGWETERKEVPAGTWTVTTAADPVPLDIPLPNGGYFLLEALARDDSGRSTVTRTSFYALGDGYTAWTRYDHNRIDLVPERKTYKPGDTARIMVQSPWERATALVTTEREGVRSHRQFGLTSTQQSITVPITDDDIPNVYVSVLLIKGRTVPPSAPAADPGSGPAAETDSSDPGKPSFRLGYVELKVEDASKRLTVAVSANRTEYRPANDARVSVTVQDQQARGTASEVTLWAVDYGVLSLTAYRTPDVLRSVYVEKALQVMNVDSRQRIVSRRVLTPKGETDGGGGGADAGAGTLRKDFRVLAFWLGSVVTDAAGRADLTVKMPESLTTYRIMAVAADRRSRFGSGESEVRVNKPLTLKPTFPRFLAVGDKAHFGAVVTSQLKVAGAATVAIKSLDPNVLDFAFGAARQTVQIPAGGSIEVRFDAAGRTVGRARIQITVTLGNESDAFQDVIPVEILASPETVAAYGEAGEGNAVATETLTLPDGVVLGFGGLHVEMSSTAMVGLGEGARYLVEYPYGCAEQRASRGLAMLLAADLGDAFALPEMDTAKMRPAVQQTLKELERFQCSSGGFAYWPGSCRSVSPYLTSYILHVFKVASDLKYDVDRGMRERAYAYLERELAAPPPENESWWPSYTAWQTFAVKVLAEGGRNQDSNVNRLYGHRERMPIFALAYLHDAMFAKGESSGARVDELRRRMSNAILPEGASAHIEELSDPYLLWFWNSNVRSTAIVLNSLVRAGAEAPIRQMVRWMMAAREKGRWGNTQENAHAMESLVAYYRKYETVVPDFNAVVRLGADELAREEFKGRSTESTTKGLPMAQLLGKGEPGASRPLTFTREGAGTLFYTARLRYAADRLFQDGLDAGILIERSYAPYVEVGTRPVATTFNAGDLVRVTLTLHLTKERRFVAVTDPLPAGFEPVESWFATTAASLANAQDDQGEVQGSWFAWWQRGGFDHVERHDNRVQLFATRLDEGRHDFVYVARATTAGTFRTAPAQAEEMYEPEVFGRTATAVIDIRK